MASDNRKTTGARRGVSWWDRFRALPNDNPLKTLVITLAVALVGSILVAGSAVLLRPLQIANKEADRQQHFAELVRQLSGVAGALKGYEVTAHVVDLDTGEYVPSMEPRLFDQRRAAKDPETRVEIPPKMDVAGLKTRARFAIVYLVRLAGRVSLLVLPVRGPGYGSMLYGYLALAPDANTVVGLTFYEHTETPGLGALVDLPSWKLQWNGKKVRDEGGTLRIGVGTGRILPGSPDAPYQVDGLTGATWTGNGVTHLLHYWLGDHGFGPYLRKVQKGHG